MGDIITIAGIEFLYGKMFQIDLHNETKNEYYRVFIQKEELEQKLKLAIARGDNND